MNDDRRAFLEERDARIGQYREDAPLNAAAARFLDESLRARYSYQFDWLGLPVIQYPQDLLALQEIIWSTRPDLIIETGIARGGSLVFSASLLALLDAADASREPTELALSRCPRQVLGIDIDIRAHNRAAIESHPFATRIRMLEGSSIDEAVIAQVHEQARLHERVMVILDSSHTHEHVLAELNSYAPLVTPGNYCIVFDTVIEDSPQATFADRPWGPGNSPKSAVKAFLAAHPEFDIDTRIQDKLLVTVARDGYLRRLDSSDPGKPAWT